ncbi:hypothetical protein FOMPIDRAFT_1161088 [Fomitopsis schrenkii]|uniref:Chromo domain-containing protein n=1 Tax=Fomitopsis schrenkii TaxID=2126942 RepID=S8EA51_FOMSC|nr:hypothetical protein FOMPIDRAFT_1161088 [Fomitopsis schrenkii]
MAYATPRVAKQHHENFDAKDGKQSSQRNMDAWKCEIDDKIWQMNMDLDDFLHFFVPSDKALPPSKARDPFNVPVGGQEIDMYEPLCAGLKELVKNFGPAKYLDFHNNAHQEIKFPFQLGEHTHHATKPDIVASLPGLAFDLKLPDRWRHISVVFEAKATEEGDPMVFRSKTHNETLTGLWPIRYRRLALALRYLLYVVAQRPRFPLAALVESRYMAVDGNASWLGDLHHALQQLPVPVRFPLTDALTVDVIKMCAEGLQASLPLSRRYVTKWIPPPPPPPRKCRPSFATCLAMFASGRYSVRLQQTLLVYSAWLPSLQHHTRFLSISVRWSLRGTSLKVCPESLARKSKVVHVKNVALLLFDNFHSSPTLTANRAEGISDSTGRPGLSSAPAFMEAWGASWSGLALCVLSHELGDDEGMDGGSVGHQTCAGFFQAHHHHRWFERDHVRLVSQTVGTPISQFQSTGEMVQALRDAVYGHMLAFEAGIMHRDISEGNVMIANGRGFLHDFDYGFNWKLFLRFLDYEDTEESWEEFVRTERGIPRAAGASDSGSWPQAQVSPGPANEWADTGSSPPPRSVYVHGREEFRLGAILAERMAGRKTEYLVKWAGFRDDENTWEPRKHVENTEALENWEKLTPERREELSQRCLDAGAQPEGPRSPRYGVVDEGLGGAQPSPRDRERRMMECKLRTGTFYFMAVEVLQRKMVIHEARHDLESFYWVLLWLVLRHTRHSEYDYHGRLKDLFDQITEEKCADTKKLWLMRDVEGFEVYDNPPLNSLLEGFAKLCNGNSELEPPLRVPSPVTHRSVLELFDRVLGRSDWPESDRAILFKPEEDVEQVCEARPRSTWASTNQSILSRLSQGGANTATRSSRSLIQDDYPAVLGSNMLPISGGSLTSDADPHTPRTVSS